MSRSYKKNAYWGQRQNPEDKKIANHKVRQKLKNHLDWNIQHNDYKRLFNSWDIRDYGHVVIWEDYYKDSLKWFRWTVNLYGEEHARELGYTDDKNEIYNEWYKHYKRK